MSKTTDTVPDRPFQWVLTVIGGIAGTGAILLPFAAATSPAEVLFSPPFSPSAALSALAVSFFFPILVLAAYLRYLIGDGISRVELILGGVLGLSLAGQALVLTLWMVTSSILDDSWVMAGRDYLAGLSSLTVLAVGVMLGIRNRRLRVPPVRNVLLCMQVGYVANVSFCLVSFAELWEVGAYVSLVTVLAYGVQVSILSTRFGPDFREDAVADLPDIQKRIAGLEKRNHYMMLAGVIALLAIAFAFIVEDLPTKEVITARKLVVVDDEGVPRARLEASHGGAGLYFSEKDDPQSYRLALTLYWGQPELVMHGPDAWPERAALIVGKHGPSLVFQDEQGSVRAVFGVNRLPSNRWPRSEPETVRDESSIQLFDAGGQTVYQVP